MNSEVEGILKVLLGIILGVLLAKLFFKQDKAPSKVTKKSNKPGIPKTIAKGGYNHVLYERDYIPPQEAIKKSENFYQMMNTRRSVRFFSDKHVPIEVIENVIRTAGTSPSGAHQQPWTFVVIKDKELKHKIRMAAEEEEKINYDGRMNDKWQRALDKIGTDANKSYIDIVPYIIVVFKQTHSFDPESKF